MSEFIPQSDHLKPKLMSFYWGCNIKIEEQMSGLRSREEIVTESFMLISNQHQNNRATRYSHVLGGGLREVRKVSTALWLFYVDRLPYSESNISNKKFWCLGQREWGVVSQLWTVFRWNGSYCGTGHHESGAMLSLGVLREAWPAQQQRSPRPTRPPHSLLVLVQCHADQSASRLEGSICQTYLSNWMDPNSWTQCHWSLH